jgi:hypothetical protein
MAIPPSVVEFRQISVGARVTSGTTLLEAMIATAMVALFISGAFAINSQALKFLRNAKDASAAEICTRDGLEKMRNAPWERMVDPLYLRDTVLSPTGNTFPNLKDLTVTINVSAYVTPNGSYGATPITVTRNAVGETSILAAGDEGMINEKIVKATVTASWSSANRKRTKEAYSLVSRGGISGRNK